MNWTAEFIPPECKPSIAMLPQPPPDAPAPPPSEAAIRSQTKWKWMVGIGVVCMLGFVVLLLLPMMIRGQRKHSSRDQSEAVNNARQIGLGLFEFEFEYESFPNANTIAAVMENTESSLPLGSVTSNDLLRQLIASEIVQSEQLFYAKIQGARKSDGVFTGGRALEKGECGFSYISGLDPAGNPSRPIVVTPVIPGTVRFDPKPFDGKAIILKMDNSVTTMPINKDGHVIVNGMNLLDPKNPIWGKETWTLHWPE